MSNIKEKHSFTSLNVCILALQSSLSNPQKTTSGLCYSSSPKYKNLNFLKPCHRSPAAWVDKRVFMFRATSSQCDFHDTSFSRKMKTHSAFLPLFSSQSTSVLFSSSLPDETGDKSSGWSLFNAKEVERMNEYEFYLTSRLTVELLFGCI